MDIAGVVLLAVSSVVGACSTSSGLVTSFADITSEADRQGSIDGNQNRLISLAGMLLHGEPGQLLRYKVDRNPTTAVSLTGDAHSEIVVRKTVSPVQHSDVIDVRDKIIDVRSAASRLVEWRLEVAYFSAAIAAVEARGGEPPASDRDSLKKARSSLESAKIAFAKAVDTAQRAIKTPGIVVTRWAAKSKSSADVGLGELLGLSASGESMTSGFAVFGGLRTTQISLGSDFEYAKSHVQGGFDIRWHWLPFRMESDDENVRLVTYTIETRHVAYVQDYSSAAAFGARISARARDLQNLGGTLNDLDRIEIAATFARVAELSNMGFLSAVSRRVFRRPWPGSPRPDSNDQRATDEYKRAEKDYKDFLETYSSSEHAEEGWRIIYAVDIDFADLHWHFR